MRHTASLPRRGLVLALAVFLALPMTARADAGASVIRTETELVEGLTYRNTVTVNGGNRVESFALELGPESAARAILLQGDETIYGGGTITTAVANAQAMGYHVLGAINTDFFSMSTGVPSGIVIEDGVYKSSSYQEKALAILEGGTAIVMDPRVSLSLYDQASGLSVEVNHLNKARNNIGGLYLLNSDFSGVSTRSDGPGWYVRMKVLDPAQNATEPPAPEETPEESPEEGLEATESPAPEATAEVVEGVEAEGDGESAGETRPPETTPVEPPEGEPSTEPDPEEESLPREGEKTTRLTVNSSLTLVVTEAVRSDVSLPIGPGEFILTAADLSYREDAFQLFQPGNFVTLTTQCADPDLSQARWACGVGDLMVSDGVVTDTSDWTYTKDGRQPRSALGIKPDGSILVYAVDGRRAGYSAGLTQVDLAQELAKQGCRWVVNLDGGGSTALSAWIPGQTGPKTVSLPSDGQERRCATYLLFVTEDTGDGTADRLVFPEEGQVVLAGSSLALPGAVAVDKGLGLVPVDMSGLTVTSEAGLGTIENGTYTAGSIGGTDTLRLQVGELTGTAQVHVVTALTQMTLSAAGGGQLSALSLKPGEQVALSVTGSYWGRTALRDLGPVRWTVQGNVGGVDEKGTFTASKLPGSGFLTCEAGGQSKTIPVTVNDRHVDVGPEHWAYDAVEYCYEKGIVNGVSPTEFGRDLSIIRGDFMQMLYNAMGRPALTEAAAGFPFGDVVETDYYHDAIVWAWSLGLTNGVDELNFAPRATISREQAFTILYRFLPQLGKECPPGTPEALEPFADRELIAEYAREAAATLVTQGLVNGKGGGMAPRDTLTRAEMAVLIQRFLEFTPTPGETTDPSETEGPAESPEPTGPVMPEESPEPSESGLPAGSPEPTDPDLPEESPGPAEPSEPSETPGEGLEEPVAPGENGRMGTVFDADKGLNVRAGPSTGYPKVGSLRNGDRVEILELMEGWCRIRLAEDPSRSIEGYASRDYIKLDGDE